MGKRKPLGVSREGDLLNTQRQFILNEMLKGRKLSQMEVTRDFGFTRLSAIIFDLKEVLEENGNEFVIKDEFVKGVNRYGNTCRYKNYWIERV